MKASFVITDTRACVDEDHLVLLEGRCFVSEGDIKSLHSKLKELGFRIAVLANGKMLIARSREGLFSFKAPDSFTFSRSLSFDRARSALEAIFDCR